MLRRYLCCNLSSKSLDKLDQLNRLCLGQVLNVQACFFGVGNHDITCHHAVLSHTSRTANVEVLLSDVLVETQNAVQLWVFLMKRNQCVVFFRQLQSVTQSLGWSQWNTVIRKTEGPIFKQSLEVRQMLTIKIFGNCGIGIDVNVLFCRAGQNLFQGCHIWNSGIGICHHDNWGKATRSSRKSTCVNVFLVCLTRFTEMHVNIHQTRRYNEPSCINHLGTIFLNKFSDFHHFFAINKDICNLIKSRLRVNNTTIFNQ